MADNSSIQWMDHTWNPWHGCQKVSAGCAHCYMYEEKARYGQDPRAVVRSSTTFGAPLGRSRGGAWKWADGSRVFTCSWSDFFIEEADAWRAAAWDIIRQRPGLTFQILTKRPERIAACLPPDWGDGWPHVWIGTSVEDQRAADQRIPHLLRVPAAVRFLSCEPLLGEVDLTMALETFRCHDAMLRRDPAPVQWVIVGGESGPRARVCELAWIGSLVSQCQAAGVPVFVKQLGLRASDAANGLAGAGLEVDADAAALVSRRLRDRKGADMAEWPEALRVRQWPEGRS